MGMGVPSRLSRGTKPQKRLSLESLRLSPVELRSVAGGVAAGPGGQSPSAEAGLVLAQQVLANHLPEIFLGDFSLSVASSSCADAGGGTAPFNTISLAGISFP